MQFLKKKKIIGTNIILRLKVACNNFFFFVLIFVAIVALWQM